MGPTINAPTALAFEPINIDDTHFTIIDILKNLRIDVLRDIQRDVASILGLLRDPNFGLQEIKNEVKNIEIGVNTISDKIDRLPAGTTAFSDTETIPLDGELKKGDFKLLMDTTPFMTVNGHVTMTITLFNSGISLKDKDDDYKNVNFERADYAVTITVLGTKIP